MKEQIGFADLNLLRRRFASARGRVLPARDTFKLRRRRGLFIHSSVSLKFIRRQAKFIPALPEIHSIGLPIEIRPNNYLFALNTLR